MCSVRRMDPQLGACDASTGVHVRFNPSPGFRERAVGYAAGDPLEVEAMKRLVVVAR